MFDKLQGIEERYDKLMALISDPAVQADQQEYRRHTRSLSEIQPLVEQYREYKAVSEELGEARELAAGDDEDLRELAEQELDALEARRDDLLGSIKVLLLPKDPNDEKNVVLEIRAGTGGDEAGLFAADLYRMYHRFAEEQGWRVEELSLNETGVGAIKEVVALIEGRRVYSRLKYESGVHRVQRVPTTEASGRIHTSTATVAVLPEAEEVDIRIDPKELRIRHVLLERARRPERQHHPTRPSASPTCRPVSSSRSRTRSRRSRTGRRR